MADEIRCPRCGCTECVCGDFYIGAVADETVRHPDADGLTERLLGEWQRGEIPVDVVLTHVAERVRVAVETARLAQLERSEWMARAEEAVEQERAAWVTKIEALADEWDKQRKTYPKDNAGVVAHAAVKLCGEELRALLPADDTEAEPDARQPR